jgi:hypothetical protein
MKGKTNAIKIGKQSTSQPHLSRNNAPSRCKHQNQRASLVHKHSHIPQETEPTYRPKTINKSPQTAENPFEARDFRRFGIVSNL